EIDLFTRSPPLAFGNLRHLEIPCGDVQRFCVTGMDDESIRSPDGRDLDLRQLDGADMNAWRYPAREEYVLDGVGGAHHDVGLADGVFRLTDRIERDAENRAHLAGECRAVVAIGAEAADRVDVAHGAHGRQLRAGLPTRTQNADRLCVLARKVFDAEAI